MISQTYRKEDRQRHRAKNRVEAERQRDRERETPTPLTFSGRLCMHKSSSERQINSSIGLCTHCNLKNNQRSMAYYMVYVSLIVSTPERYHKHKGRQETRYNSTLQWTTLFRVDNPSGITTRHIIFIFIYRIYLGYLGYWDLRIEARRKIIYCNNQKNSCCQESNECCNELNTATNN